MSITQNTGIPAAVAYIESHLVEDPSWNIVAEAVCYSPYHLHRRFTQTVGTTPHSYIRRRQLTEAARQLVFSSYPILEIALTAGYESQQSFSAAFKALYKKPPLEYRENKLFYPLQLPFSSEEPSTSRSLARSVVYATQDDLTQWPLFLAMVAPGFPCLKEKDHLEQVRLHILDHRLLLVREGPSIIAAAAFSPYACHINFLAVRPQFRHCGALEALLSVLSCQHFAGREISISTFREGDRADIGQRAAYQRLGFQEAELQMEFGYPTQRLILPPHTKRSHYGA